MKKQQTRSAEDRLRSLAFRVELWKGLYPEEDELPTELAAETAALERTLGVDVVREVLEPWGVALREQAVFVELARPPQMAHEELVIEVTEPDGSRLLVRSVGTASEAARVVSAFRRGGR